MVYSAVDLSKYMVTKCIEDGCPITNLQLQKILFYVQRDYLKRGNPAFVDEIQAWKFGPVVPTVYYYFCSYGAMPISIPYKDQHIDQKDEDYIDPVLEKKRILDPWDLVEETHKKGGAWDQIFHDGRGDHKPIPVDLIRKAG